MSTLFFIYNSEIRQNKIKYNNINEKKIKLYKTEQKNFDININNE